MNNIIDNHFIQHLEYKQDLSFKRVDSDTIDKLIEKEHLAESVLNEEDSKAIEKLFKDSYLNKAIQTDLKAMSPNDPPVVIVRPEFMRRMSEMQMMTKADQQHDMFGNHFNVIVNSNHPVIAQGILIKSEDERKELADYLIKLALLEQNMLKGEELYDCLTRTLHAETNAESDLCSHGGNPHSRQRQGQGSVRLCLQGQGRIQGIH